MRASKRAYAHAKIRVGKLWYIYSFSCYVVANRPRVKRDHSPWGAMANAEQQEMDEDAELGMAL
jgi:hypothetical protein